MEKTRANNLSYALSLSGTDLSMVANLLERNETLDEALLQTFSGFRVFHGSVVGRCISFLDDIEGALHIAEKRKKEASARVAYLKQVKSKMEGKIIARINEDPKISYTAENGAFRLKTNQPRMYLPFELTEYKITDVISEKDMLTYQIDQKYLTVHEPKLVSLNKKQVKKDKASFATLTQGQKLIIERF